MSFQFSFILKTRSLFVSSISLELFQWNGSMPVYVSTYWYAEATSEAQVYPNPTPESSSLVCPPITTTTNEYYSSAFNGDNPVSVIIPLTDLQNANNFIVVKSCVFTNSGAIADLDGSNGTSTTTTTGIVLNQAGIINYTSPGQVPTAIQTFGIADTFNESTTIGADSGVISWYYPVNTGALSDSRSTLELTINGTLI